MIIPYQAFIDMSKQDPNRVITVDRVKDISIESYILGGKILYFKRSNLSSSFHCQTEVSKEAYETTLDNIAKEIEGRELSKYLKQWDEFDIDKAICTFDNDGRKIMIQSKPDPEVQTYIMKTNKKAFWNTNFRLISYGVLCNLIAGLLQYSAWQSLSESDIDRLLDPRSNCIYTKTMYNAIREAIKIAKGEITFTAQESEENADDSEESE